MYSIIKKTITNLLLLPLFFFVLFTPLVKATENNSASEILQDKLYDAHEKEYQVFEQYNEFVDYTYTAEDFYLIKNKYASLNNFWHNTFEDSQKLYLQCMNTSSDAELVRICNHFYSYVTNAIKALDEYDNAFFNDTLSEYEFEYALNRGDNLMQSAIEDFDTGADLYNDYTGASSQIAGLHFLYVVTTIMVILAVILLLKSFTNSIYEADIQKAKIYRSLLGSTLWMLVGLGVTTFTLKIATDEGGSYYMFWGPILVGGWQFITGLAQYFGKDRHTLNQMKVQSSKELLTNALADIK